MSVKPSSQIVPHMPLWKISRRPLVGPLPATTRRSPSPPLTHELPLQERPLAHVKPQRPQLLGSREVSVHSPPQTVIGGKQGSPASKPGGPESKPGKPESKPGKPESK